MSARQFQHEPLNFSRMPPAIRTLIIANVVVFLVANIAGGGFYDMFGLVPAHVLRDRWIWQPFSYLFVHGGVMHLLFNLFALWMFGLPVESQWGELEFIKFFFICGLGAAAASIALAPHSTLPVIGASGPVYGMLVAFAMLYPDSVVYLYFLIPVKASHMAILFGLIEFFTGASGATPGVARFAHLGGMLTGYLYIRWWWVVKIKARALFRRVSEGAAAAAPRVTRRPARVEPQLSSEEKEQAEMAEIDRILDKILVSGLDSLTDEEKAIMRKYSERTQH
jgi:membrane associated rhomboid family serine protease